MKKRRVIGRGGFAFTFLAASFGVRMATHAATDPLLDLFVQKGYVTQEEANRVKAEAESMRTNDVANAMPAISSPWKLNKALKSVELFGDLRTRYEERTANAPGGKIELNRFRYAARIGLRGEVFDDFYYGLRLETSANPRSAWITFGQSSTASPPYQGPFGKSSASINLGQIYLGWKPTTWLDLTIGKMPQPLYTTPMVWDSDINPEGAAERLTYTTGNLDLFANFTQFLYQDMNPNSASGGFGFNGTGGQSTENVFQFGWQAGFNYHFTTNTSFKMAATVYKYAGLQRSKATATSVTSPYFGDPFIGEGAYLGPGTGTANGYSGYGTSGTLPGYSSLGYPNNQVGLNDLLIVELPFEFNFKIRKLNARIFGDASYNLEGNRRAKQAAAGYQAYLANQATPPTITGFSPQTQDVKAYQIGFGLGSGGIGYGPTQGLVYGSASRRNAWEFRTYWQHVEQYALDPNLLDSDFFEGRANMEGVYAAFAYGLGQNVIGTFRYGHAHRINDKLGTGGSNQDIPQINPINDFDLLQFDVTLKF